MQKRILAVDDSLSMRMLLRASLTNAGYEVAEAEDGRAALEWLENNEPTLVITDINMPRLDGFGLIAELRAQERFRDMPILVLTTESLPEKKARARRRGDRLDRQTLRSREADRRGSPRDALSKEEDRVVAEQLITFQMADKLLGVDIMAIREIRAWTPTTAIPHAPSFVRGVVNLRGTVLPVIDLSERLGWGRIDPTGRHVIIVLQIGSQLNGLIVDSVNDIVRVEPAEMQPPPELSQAGAERFLEGLIAVEDRMAMVLDLRAMAVGTVAAPPLAEAA